MLQYQLAWRAVKMCRLGGILSALLLFGCAICALAEADRHPTGVAGYQTSVWQYQPSQHHVDKDDDEEVEDPRAVWARQNVPYQPPITSSTYQPRPEVAVRPASDSSVVVVPRLGTLRGNARYKVVRNRPVHAFLGVKYGSVGDGLARFQQARAADYSRSNEIINATREPAHCPQYPDLSEITNAEARGERVDDCLTLNIYTPSLSGSNPVLVYVHGEMLFDGAAEEGQPDYFMEHDVVLVSVNYRLAPFGFLSTLSDEMPGNVALADIQLALEWVQQYIRPFGGNADEVTLFGQAGGATLVHALSLSGKAHGLFHKLILQSGTALNPYFVDEDPLATVRGFARSARCPFGGAGRGGHQGLHDCFGRMSTTELLTAFKRHLDQNDARGLAFTGGFKLSIGDRLGYLNQHPAALVANSTSAGNSYPLLVGVAKDAGAFILSEFYDELKEIRSRNISEYIEGALRHITLPRYYGPWVQLARQQIFTAEDERNPRIENLAQGLLELVNLVLYRGPIIDSLRYTYRQQPAYLYCFDYRGQFHRFGHLTSPLPFAADATLSDENIYLFPYPNEVSQLNELDRNMARTLTELWANFARSGMPHATSWPRATSENGPFVRFSNDKNAPLELDYHFGEGIGVPNLYPHWFTTTTTTTSTTRRPYYNSNQPLPDNNHPPQQQPHQRPTYYRPYETVLPADRQQQQQQQQQQAQRYPYDYQQQQQAYERRRNAMSRYTHHTN